MDLMGVSKHYQVGPVEVRALDNVELHVADGEFVVVLGPLGSGKTALLNIIGALAPSLTVRKLRRMDIPGKLRVLE